MIIVEDGSTQIVDGVIVSNMTSVRSVFLVRNVGSTLVVNNSELIDNNFGDEGISFSGVVARDSSVATVTRMKFLRNRNLQVGRIILFFDIVLICLFPLTHLFPKIFSMLVLRKEIQRCLCLE